MAINHTHEDFLSPFTWRYGGDAMRRIWSLAHTRRLWRKIWVALAEAQASVGLVTEAQVADLKAHQHEVNIERAHELEQELKHDLMAEVHTYAEQCPVGGGIIHLGATSMDIEDNAEALKLRESMDVVLEGLKAVLGAFAEVIEREAYQVCMAFTHLQPAEPTTLGYRLAFVAQDFLADYETCLRVKSELKGKGFKGAVGTSASYSELLRDTSMTPRELESKIMKSLALEAFEVTHQTYPRRQEFDLLNALASIAMTAYKFAFDLRLLQSPTFGEWAEPFGTRQIGSSAMPFKRNPIMAENVDSLARFVATLPRVAWDNSAHHLLERTLDDSGNRRAVLPEAFLATDEILIRTKRLIQGLRIDDRAIERNLAVYGVFSATERVMMEAVRRGGNRQVLHEVIRQHSLTAWEAMRQGQENPLVTLIMEDERVTRFISADEIPALLEASSHIGDAPERALNLARQVKMRLSQ